MAVNFSTMVNLPCQDMFAVAITVFPIASDPGVAAYAARGIFNTGPIDVPMEDGSVYSDQQTILDVRNAEFSVVPKQGDRITIPFDCNGEPRGDYEVVSSDDNGGGQTTLTLRKFEFPRP